MRTKALIVELFDRSEIIAVLPYDAPDPPQDVLDDLARTYAMQSDWRGDGKSVATARITERIVMFREHQLTAEQQAAAAGLP